MNESEGICGIYSNSMWAHHGSMCLPSSILASNQPWDWWWRSSGVVFLCMPSCRKVVEEVGPSANQGWSDNALWQAGPHPWRPVCSHSTPKFRSFGGKRIINQRAHFVQFAHFLHTASRSIAHHLDVLEWWIGHTWGHVHVKPSYLNKFQPCCAHFLPRVTICS